MNILKELYKETEEWVMPLLFIWLQLVAFIVGVAIVFAPVWLVLYILSLWWNHG